MKRFERNRLEKEINSLMKQQGELTKTIEKEKKDAIDSLQQNLESVYEHITLCPGVRRGDVVYFNRYAKDKEQTIKILTDINCLRYETYAPEDLIDKVNAILTYLSNDKTSMFGTYLSLALQTYQETVAKALINQQTLNAISEQITEKNTALSIIDKELSSSTITSKLVARMGDYFQNTKKPPTAGDKKVEYRKLR